MFEQEIERKIGDFRELCFPEFIPRESRLQMADSMVSTIIGARRAGKSYRTVQAASELIKRKAIKSINHICLLDFDNPILSSIKDIIQRYNLSKTKQCIHLYNYLMSNIGKAHTLQSSFRYLKQAGFKSSRDTIREYINWAKDSWLLFTVPIFQTHLKIRNETTKKFMQLTGRLQIKTALSGMALIPGPLKIWFLSICINGGQGSITI